MKKQYHHIRKQYTKGTLDASIVKAEPSAQLENWIEEATIAGCSEPTAMILSTAGEDLRPSSRVVLMKGLDESGILFFTNYDSRKGKHLLVNPNASLLFFWPDLERQVRIEGKVFKTTGMESDIYFLSRPLPSRISAMISPQSQEVPSREWLIEKRSRAENDQQPPQRPEHWGGYRFIPDYFEFWQGREDRLHDRIFYRMGENGWTKGRLAP